MTPQELHILLHTIGLDDPYQEKSYRNHFVADDGHSDLPAIQKLCLEGLMEEQRAPGFLEAGDRVFRVTDCGRQAAERLRRRPTRAQRRYHRFLEVADCCPDLTFREFLTLPAFAEARGH